MIVVLFIHTQKQRQQEVSNHNKNRDLVREGLGQGRLLSTDRSGIHWVFPLLCSRHVLLR